MYLGNIAKLFREKEYGSIRTKNGEDIHFHKLCLWNTPFTELIEGQEVEFEMQPFSKGFLAFHIRPSGELLLRKSKVEEKCLFER